MKKKIRILINKGSAHAGYEASYDLETADYLIGKGFAEEIKLPQEENPVKPIIKGTKND